MYTSLLHWLPKNHLSYLAGLLFNLPLPRFLAVPVLRCFAALYKIDTDSAAKSIPEYPSIGSFFVRDLKEGLRPVTSTGIASPVDGLLRSCGPIQDCLIEQVKGKDYSLVDLVGGEEKAYTYRDGVFFNFYLSPRDYHHIHSPVSGTIIGITHIPGKLWPVNDWSLRRINNLFAVNERVIVYIDSVYGVVAVVMIGAFNVGSISLTFDSLRTNRDFFLRSKKIDHQECHQAVPVKAGERIGTFNIGSSVVLLFAKDRCEFAAKGPASGYYRYGQRVA